MWVCPSPSGVALQVWAKQKNFKKREVYLIRTALLKTCYSTVLQLNCLSFPFGKIVLSSHRQTTRSSRRVHDTHVRFPHQRIPAPKNKDERHTNRIELKNQILYYLLI